MYTYMCICMYFCLPSGWTSLGTCRRWRREARNLWWPQSPVCMYVCMYVYIYVSMYVFLPPIRMNFPRNMSKMTERSTKPMMTSITCVCMYWYVYVYVCISASDQDGLSKKLREKHESCDDFNHLCVCICMYVCVYCMWYIYTYIHIYIYIYIYIYM